MPFSRRPIIAAAAAAAYTLAVVRRMEREYRTEDTFVPVTVALLYSAYVANVAALAWAAHHLTWTFGSSYDRYRQKVRRWI